MARKVDPENRANNMKKLDEALLSLLKNKEIEDITIREICDTAGLSKGLFHYYYESKEQILYERFKMINLNIEKAIADKITYKNVSNDLDIYINFMANNCKNRGYKYFRQIYKYLMMTGEKDNDLKDSQIYTYIYKIIKAGQDNGQVLTSIDSHRISEILFFNIRGLIVQWIINSGESDLELIMKDYLKIFKNGILI